jgi:hypothetical protein
VSERVQHPSFSVCVWKLAVHQLPCCLCQLTSPALCVACCPAVVCRAVIRLLARLAAFAPERFAQDYLVKCILHLLAVLKHTGGGPGGGGSRLGPVCVCVWGGGGVPGRVCCKGRWGGGGRCCSWVRSPLSGALLVGIYLCQKAGQSSEGTPVGCLCMLPCSGACNR